METLGKLFGSGTKVRLMRLFLFNPKVFMSTSEAARKSKVSAEAARKTIADMEKAGMVKRRTTTRVVNTRVGRKIKREKRKFANGWRLNEKFAYLSQLSNLLINTEPLTNNEIIKRLSNIGRIKLIIVAGVFIQSEDSRIDILVVGDKLKKGQIDGAIKNIEAEVGKELRYAVFDTSEFLYRLSVYDKLVRDILDYPHKKVLSRLEL